VRTRSIIRFAAVTSACRTAVLASIPRAHQVQTLLYELIETDRELNADDEDEEAPETSGRK